MKRIVLAALLALPALLLTGSDARAQGPHSYLGCGGFCFKFLGHLHQHGPLYNYGPYAGYYPFEPYGPWNSQLQYTGPNPNQGTCGLNGLCGNRGHGGQGGCGQSGFGGGCGAGGGLLSGGLLSGLGLGGRNGASSCSTCGSTGWGAYSATLFQNVFHRSHPLAHRARHSTGSSTAGFAPVGCGTPVHRAKACGGCTASAFASDKLEAVSLVASIESVSPGQFRRER